MSWIVLSVAFFYPPANAFIVGSRIKRKKSTRTWWKIGRSKEIV